MGKIAYPLPFRAAIFAAHGDGEELDAAIAGLFPIKIELASYASSELVSLAAEMAEARLLGNYDVDALAMVVLPPRDAPGWIERMMLGVDSDLTANGMRTGERVDGRRMEGALARLNMTPCGLAMDEYFYLAALESFGGSGGVGAVARMMGGGVDAEFKALESRMLRFGLIERGRKNRKITAFGSECFRRCEDRRLL